MENSLNNFIDLLENVKNVVLNSPELPEGNLKSLISLITSFLNFSNYNFKNFNNYQKYQKYNNPSLELLKTCINLPIFKICTLGGYWYFYLNNLIKHFENIYEFTHENWLRQFLKCGAFNINHIKIL